MTPTTPTARTLRRALAAFTGVLMALYLLWTLGQNASAFMEVRSCSFDAPSRLCELASGVRWAVAAGAVVLWPALGALCSWLAYAALASRRPVPVTLGVLFLGVEVVGFLLWWLRWLATPAGTVAAMGSGMALWTIVNGALTLACAVLLWRRWRYAAVVTAVWLALTLAASLPLLSVLAVLPLAIAVEHGLLLLCRLALMLALVRPGVRRWFCEQGGNGTG